VLQELGIQTAVISGGASLAPHLDDFYEAVGIPVLNGWGMTETSPVITCRRLRPHDPTANVRGTTGFVIPGSCIRCAALVRGRPNIPHFWRLFSGCATQPKPRSWTFNLALCCGRGVGATLSMTGTMML
jgi:acyl-CoA synthetase (AMP-forming)/AMP-acid ligase II